MELKDLKGLYLGGTGVTDAGLKHLETMTQLETLDLTRTRVTGRGVSRLKESLPSLKIIRGK